MDQRTNNLHTEKLNWFVIKTNSQAEKKVFERLISLGFESFLPLYSTMRQWSDRKKKIYLPLIPSVVFVKCRAIDLSKTFAVPGMNGTLNYLGKPAIVKEFEIENLRILLMDWDDDIISICNDCIEEGVLVEVIRGPFKGLTATSVTKNGKHRVVVNIESLGNNFVVNVPRSFLKKLNREAA